MRKMIMIMPLMIVTMIMTLGVAMMVMMNIDDWASCAEWRQVHEEDDNDHATSDCNNDDFEGGNDGDNENDQLGKLCRMEASS